MSKFTYQSNIGKKLHQYEVRTGWKQKSRPPYFWRKIWPF